jgi:hypothetical protein
MQTERRKYDRFQLELPAQIDPCQSTGANLGNGALTQDISCRGAYILSSSPLALGASITLTFFIPLEKLGFSSGSYSSFRCKGTIVRRDPCGMAVQFHQTSRIQCCTEERRPKASAGPNLQ